MSIEDFLDQFVEGYLLGDLETMAGATLPRGKVYGAVGYPMLATTLSGMELLGWLLMPAGAAFNPKKSDTYFKNYWNHYFSRQNPAYTGLASLFRQLLRNGVSHTFVAKPGIFVEKGSNRQTSIDTVNQKVHLDCNVFYKEFEASYHNFVRPIVDDPTFAAPTDKTTMQQRLDELGVAYSRDSTRLFARLPALNPSLINVSNRERVPLSVYLASQGARARASGPSGPLGPSGSITIITTDATTEPLPSTTNTTTVPFYPTPSGTLPPTNGTYDNQNNYSG